jgi:hypothetical protein
MGDIPDQLDSILRRSVFLIYPQPLRRIHLQPPLQPVLCIACALRSQCFLSAAAAAASEASRKTTHAWLKFYTDY